MNVPVNVPMNLIASDLTATLAAALSWDPQIRGALIILTAFVILPGSVYLLLATNTGSKLGFLLAAAGFFGWMAVMGWVWVVYGIGIKGDPATWKVEEVVTGDVAALSTVEETGTFPIGWEKLKTGDSALGDATASADKVLAPSEGGAEPAAGEVEVSTDHTFTPVFESLEDYTMVGGYRKGGENYWIPGGGLATEAKVGNDGTNPLSKVVKRLQRGPFHKPHFVVIQVAPAADPTKPPTSVVMVRDLGDLRLPNLRFAISMSIVFTVVVSVLHRRDKEIMASRAAPATAR